MSTVETSPYIPSSAVHVGLKINYNTASASTRCFT